MKKILFLLFLTCGFLFSSAEDRKEFPVKEEPQISVGPRMPDSDTAIYAYYKDGLIYFQFSFDIREIEITVINETTGKIWQNNVDCPSNVASITTSTDSGDYYITLVIDNTTFYYAKFTL